MNQESRSNIPVPIWWLLLLLIGVIVLAVIWGISNEQNDLTVRSEQALSDSGLSDIAVEFQGRDAILTSTVSGTDDIDRAKEIVLQQRGVRRVDGDRLSEDKKHQAKVPSVFTARADENQVTLTGVLPTQQDVNAIAHAAAVHYSSIENQLTVAKVAAAEWVGNLPKLFTQVQGWTKWRFHIGTDNARFDGLARNPEAVAALRDGYLAGFAGIEFEGRIDPDVVAASLTELLEGSATFATSSSILSTQATTLLDRAVEILQANPEAQVAVEGHTDNRGSDTENLALSKARSQAVVDYLSGGGIDDRRLDAVGYGETQPIADNATADGRAQNRRIKFVVKTEGES